MRSCMITCHPCSHHQLCIPASSFLVTPPAIQFIEDFLTCFFSMCSSNASSFTKPQRIEEAGMKFFDDYSRSSPYRELLRCG